MISKYFSKQYTITSVSAFLGIALIISIIRQHRQIKVGDKNVVFITGCDSGLGLTIAIKCYELGMFVVAGCLNSESDGANMLRNLNKKNRIVIVEVDIRNNDQIIATRNFIQDLMEKNGLTFSALINNAGVMVFGEFEWQTTSIIESQLEVNLLGTMKLTKAFLPICRKQNARIIIVTSHCAIEALPGLAPYAASKAGLKFFTDSLRVEMKKYNVNVVNFIPGSFAMQSNIFARQRDYAFEMRKEFTDEQFEFYGEYFNEYNEYLSKISNYRQPGLVTDHRMLQKFERALLDVKPKAVYKNQNMRYAFYHFLCGWSPVFVRDWLIQKFMLMPTYKVVCKLAKK